MVKIVIPYLVFEGEKIETPIGLSELLEPTWSLKDEDSHITEIVNQYNDTTYKNDNGRWVTKFEKR